MSRLIDDVNLTRVLHVTGAMNHGGQETLIMNLYRSMDKRKVQFDFLLYGEDAADSAYIEEILSNGGRIFYAKERLSRNPINYMKELKTFYRNHFEYKIVHSHLNTSSGFILRTAKSSCNWQWVFGR